MVEIGSGSKGPLQDVKISPYACNLIVQNGDPAKPVVANGQKHILLFKHPCKSKSVLITSRV
jgi:DNA-damage-inducible protein D